MKYLLFKAYPHLREGGDPVFYWIPVCTGIEGRIKNSWDFSVITYNSWEYKKNMKIIIAIAASPNKGGNSDTLLDAFIEGATDFSKKISFEKVYICDIPMHFFDFPHKIIDKKEEPELFELTQKMQKADGYVIATPTYNFNVPSRLKNLIDRMGFFSLNYQKMNMVGQPTGLLGNLRNFYIVTGGTPNGMRKCLFPLFPGFWLKIVFMYYGCFKNSSAYAGGLTFSNPAKNDKKLLKKFKKLGESYAKKF